MTIILIGVVAVAIIAGMIWLMMRIDRASSQRIERRREAWRAGGSVGPGPGGCSGGISGGGSAAAAAEAAEAAAVAAAAAAVEAAAAVGLRRRRQQLNESERHGVKCQPLGT